MSIGLELQPESLIQDPQVAVLTADDRLGHHGLDLLRHHADVNLPTAIVSEAVEAKPVVEPAEQHDVVLEPDV
jgi:hypothetical protein